MLGKVVLSRPFRNSCRSALWRAIAKKADYYEVKIVGWFEDDREARKVETRLIKQYQPIANFSWSTNGTHLSKDGAESIRKAQYRRWRKKSRRMA